MGALVADVVERTDPEQVRHQTVEAQREHANGVTVRVIDLYSLKPVDAVGLRKEAAACGNRVVTVEDHYPEGGVGDTVLSALSGTGANVTKLAVTGVPRSGPMDELFEMFGISASHIVKAVKG